MMVSQYGHITGQCNEYTGNGHALIHCLPKKPEKVNSQSPRQAQFPSGFELSLSILPGFAPLHSYFTQGTLPID
jgi:hypothetical protein